MASAVSVPVGSLPEAALEARPQAPEEVQDVAFADDQLSVEEPPFAIDVGFAVSDTVGIGGGGGVGDTVTVVEALALPPEPVQVRV